MYSQQTFSDHPVSKPRLNRKALALISGGLDSGLAMYLVKRQGIDLTAVHFPSFFSPLDASDAESPVNVLTRQLGVPLIVKPKGHEFLGIIRNPRYGHGKNINPCIDCRIYTFIKARELMEELGASFLVTGEVAGQRPMSQRRDAMRIIDKRSGCEGIVLRPLSAGVLSPTLPEREGIVDRDGLLGVAGRGRKPQLALAREIGLSGYSAPAGGCLLTDKAFAARLRDLLADREDPMPEELELLKVGRHLRLRPGLKLVVGRNEAENARLDELSPAGILFRPEDYPGPTILASGRPDSQEETLIGSILNRYCRDSCRGGRIAILDSSSGSRAMTVSDVAEGSWIADHLI